MPIFPKIVSPCPYQGPLADIVDGDVCRLCERQVFDLTHMDDDELAAFLAGCSGQTCVTYRIPPRAVAAAAAAFLTAALPLSVIAADHVSLPVGPWLASEGIAWPTNTPGPGNIENTGAIVLTGDIAYMPDTTPDERPAVRSSEHAKRAV